MEQLTQAIGQNASHAEKANRMAADAARVARQGGAMVGQLVDTMGAIDASSTRIVDIIAVIDGIAFQTNILALNAAVEAARRRTGPGLRRRRGRGARAGPAFGRRGQGDQGPDRRVDPARGRRRGAGRTGGQTMHDIVDSIGRVTGIMNDIVASSREQASGIGQVNQAIVQMDGVTQQNAALVEESAATRAMHEHAQTLADLVALFRVDAGTHTTAVKPALPPARQTAPAPKVAPAAFKPAARPAAVPAPRPGTRRAAATAETDWEAF